jgi:hypothetical protein
MEIRKFRKTYDLELIPASHEGIVLGDLAWDPLFGAPVFSRKGMPNSIFTAFLDGGLIDQGEWNELRKSCEGESLLEAQLASGTVDVNVDLVNELKHPELGQIQGEFILEKVRKFTFDNLRVKTMSDLIRIRIDGYLEDMKASRWQEYDGSIRRVCMITELYYGSMKLVVEQRYSAELETRLKKTALSIKSKTEGQHAVQYEFSNDHVPFAMRLERIRHFNG